MSEPNPRPIPVCFVASNAQLGGTELFLDSLLASLGREWIDRVLVLGEGPVAARLAARGAPVSVVPSGRRIGVLTSAIRVRRNLNARPPRIVHAHGVKAALVTAIAATGTRRRIIWHKQDTARDGRIARWIARRCSLVVGASSAVLETLEGMRVDTTVIHNAIPPYSVERSSAREAVLRILDAPPTSVLVGQVGRLAPGKGQLELVEIAPALCEAIPQARFVFVGAADPYHSEYEELLRGRVDELGLTDCVTFLGHRDDAVAITAGCDVLATPSVPDPASGWREGFGIAPVEALAVGTPVVAYSEPALVEVLGECAVLVPTGDRGALREGIEELLRSPQRREELRACGLRRARMYELPQAAAAVKAAYLAVSANGSVPDSKLT